MCRIHKPGGLFNKHLFKKTLSDQGSWTLRYFLGIESARSKKGIILSQREYILDLLSKAGILRCRSIDFSIDMTKKLLPDQGKLLEDVGRYRRLVRKLNYLTVTRPGISFAVSVVSQFLSTSITTHLETTLRILRYLKKVPGRRFLCSIHRHTRDADWVGCPFDKRSIT